MVLPGITKELYLVPPSENIFTLCVLYTISALSARLAKGQSINLFCLMLCTLCSYLRFSLEAVMCSILWTACINTNQSIK